MVKKKAKSKKKVRLTNEQIESRYQAHLAKLKQGGKG